MRLLRERGAAGVSNLELYSICLRPPSRICELRKAGCVIETRREGESRFRYFLRSEAADPAPIPTYDYAADMERRLHDTALPLFSGVR